MPKQLSFEEARKELLKSVQKRSGSLGERRTLVFDNDDVPKFIEAHQMAEEKSRKTRLMITGHSPQIYSPNPSPVYNA